MIKNFRRNFVKWSVLGFLVIALIATAVFISTANHRDSEAQAVVNEYKSKLYNVMYNSINMENVIKDNEEYKQFFTQKAFGKFVINRVMILPRQVAANKKYNLQLKDIKFKKVSSTEKNKLIFDYDLVMDILSADGSNSVENEIGQVTLVKEDGQWKIENDWFNLNDTFKKGLILDVRQVVWEQLTSKDKERVEGNWQASISNKMILTESMGIINDKSYIGKEVYLIDFQTKSISVPNNIIVYASLDNYKIVGYGYVD
jgi:hypothetical protein